VAGALLAAPPVGMLLGDLIVGRFVSGAVRERLVPFLVALIGVPLPLLLLGPPLTVVLLVLVVAGAGAAYGLGLQRPFLDAVPEAMRGQAFALLSTGLMTLQGLGPVLAGEVAGWTSPGVAIGAAGVGVLGTAGLTWRNAGTRKTVAPGR
jgi:hypothetical protein